MKLFAEYKNDGFALSMNVSNAVHGFLERGAEVVPFTKEQLYTGAVQMERDSPVSGSLETVKAVWRSFGVAIPAPLDYPEPLRRFLHRCYCIDTAGEVAAQVQRDDFIPPRFVKPVDEGKAFTGLALREFGDLQEIGCLPSDFRVYVFPVVNFLSEWRVFVLRNTVLDVKPYKGNPMIAPSEYMIRWMVREWSESRTSPPPVAYSLDVGVVAGLCDDDKPHTSLVEVNDSYGLGSYGLSPTKYAQIIAARWYEVCGRELPQGWC